MLVGLCLLGCAGILAETYLRFVSIGTDPFGASLTTKRWQKAYARLNSVYCRDEDWSEAKPPGVYRIAFLGDSFVYGWGVNDENDRFTEILQARFAAESGRAVEVMNVAWAGYNSQDHLRVIGEFLWRYDVDEVVLSYLPNDIENLVPDRDKIDPTKPVEPIYVNVESSFLLDFLFHRIVAPRIRSGPAYLDWMADAYADPKIWSQQQHVLSDIVTECQRRGYRFRAVLLPFLKSAGFRFDAQAVHAQVADFLRSLDVTALDLLPILEGRDPDELVVSGFDPHPNEEAHRLFADAIWNAFYAGNPLPAVTPGADQPAASRSGLQKGKAPQ